MVERYARAGAVGQLVRVATHPLHRRLAEGCREFAAAAGYDVLCLHTNTRTPAALPF